MDSDTTLGDIYCSRIAEMPLTPALVYQHVDGKQVSYDAESFDRHVRRIAAALQSTGVVAGERVILALSRGDHFEFAFWACQLVGAVAVPVAPIDSSSRAASLWRHIGAIQRSAGAQALLYDAAARADEARQVCANALPIEGILARPEIASVFMPGRSQYAFLQYTSGTTSVPRGCALSHTSVLKNIGCVLERIGARPGDTHVHWIPLHHDMGLMGGVLSPLVGRMRSILIHPRRFMMHPLGWIHAMANIERVHSAVPNFALAMVMKRKDRLQLAPASLRGVQTIICAAEPIDPTLAYEFLDTLAAYGLRREVFHASYGMAETVVLATSRPGGLRLSTDPDFARAEDARAYVCVGEPVSGAHLRIVGEGDRDVIEGEVGEIWLQSESLMQGYFNNPEATATKISHGWMRTGDLGFVRNGHLFVCGRLSDAIIVAGQNIFPLDIEKAASAATGLDARRIAAFGVRDGNSTEAIVIVVETRQPGADESLARRISQACVDACGVAPLEVTICSSGSLPRTTSGKLQRNLLRERFLGGELARASHAAHQAEG